MKFQQYKLGQQSRGAIVEITLQGSAANVRLMDSHNLSQFKRGKAHRYTGGLAKRSPVRLVIPSTGQWHVTVDMDGMRGTVRSSVRMLPGALPTLRQSNSPLSTLVRDKDEFTGIGSSSPEYDVFVSHASEDKNDVVRALVLALQAQGLSVWYDELVMQIGDSLRRSIDAGLSRSRFGIVVISPAFIAKPWTNYELDGIVSNSISGKQRMLPIWHNVGREEVLSFSPSLADKLARSTSNVSIEDIAIEIAGVVKPNDGFGTAAA
ncbi:hypothetical protein LEM8419_03177 [Neolewinella maritima]|uniref:TIR domain-containing protein n=1 Tax=Neolewinella maritima TaxID=1383882 RepID=A0ABN8F5P9_9BACT|nr:DUF1883 domain-containing protein [Neolewinella maritima]CAH1002258.1 hypothetical protein LEM8419_03177 [Neolewinella maritima]